MKNWLLCLAGLGAALAAAGQSSQPAMPPAALGPGNSGPYALNLKRPWAKGDEYTFSLDLALHAEGGSGQDVESWSPQYKDQKIVFLGKARVMDVDANGEGTTLVVRVEKAAVTEKKKARSLKVEGSDLGVSFLLGQANFTQKDGQAIPPEDLAILKQVFPLPKGMTEADYLSPGRAVNPGETWAINRESLVKALSPPAAKDAAAAVEVTEGTVRFEAIENIGGIEFVHLVARWSFKTGDSDRFIGTKATQIKEDLYLPRDPASKATRRVTEVSGRVNGRVRNAENQLLEVKGLTKVTRKVDITAR